MTNKLISSLESNGAVFEKPAPDNEIALASAALQQIRAAVLPEFMIEFYRAANGAILGDGYIFGTSENKSTGKFPVPTITQINNELSNLAMMRGKTIFGRNDLFLFAFDAAGVCMMLDNTSLKVLRKYEDPHRAINDCLIVGKM